MHARSAAVQPAVLSLLLLAAGCGGLPDPRIQGSGDGPGGEGGSASELVVDIAYWGTGVGAFCAVAAVIVFVFVSRRVGIQLFAAGVGTTVTCQLLLWVGEYLALITGILTLGLMVVLGWKYRHLAESFIGRDLNGDGIIGDPTDAEAEPGDEAAAEEVAPAKKSASKKKKSAKKGGS